MKKIFFVISILFVVKISTAQSTDTLLVQLYRGSYNNSLPEFEILVYSSGKAIYSGITNAAYMGTTKTIMPQSFIDYIFEYAEALNYFKLQESFTENLFAFSKADLYLLNSKTQHLKRVSRKGNIPKPIMKLEDYIIAEVEKATKIRK